MIPIWTDAWTRWPRPSKSEPMRDDRSYIEAVRAAGKARIISLVKQILPDPKAYHTPGYYHCRNPAREDRNVGSFWVLTTGEATGGWRDMATGEGGDVIDLVALSLRLSRGEALHWLADWTGIRRLSEPMRQARVTQWRAEADQAAMQAAQDLPTLRRRAKALWLAGLPIEPPAAGAEPSPAWRYLTEARALNLPAIGGAPSLLRWLPRHRHRESGLERPCIVAGIVDVAGALIGVHRTWLRPDGRDKAQVRPARKVWPRGCAGGLIWLTRGGSRHGPIEAGRRGETSIVILGEGIEDALTGGLGEREARSAAFVSLAYLPAVPDQPCAEGYVLLRDNDWHAPDAIAQFEAGLRHISSHGKPTEWIGSPHGKDFNDLAQAEARAI